VRRPEERYGLIEIQGSRAAAFVEQITPMDIGDLEEREWRFVTLLERDGQVMSPGLIQRPGAGFDRYRLLVPVDRAGRVVAWLRHLSDGYVRFDDTDLWGRLPGPVVVRELSVDAAEQAALGQAAARHHLSQVGATYEDFDPPVSHKPYFIGLYAPGYVDPVGSLLSPFQWQETERPLRRTSLYDWHVQHGAKMAPFAGWEMPLWYSSISDEHRAVRGAAGLFDVSHMGVMEVTGPHAAYFLNLVTTNGVKMLRPGESQYSYLLAPDGRVIDDLMVYMLDFSRYLLIVNAANGSGPGCRRSTTGWYG